MPSDRPDTSFSSSIYDGHQPSPWLGLALPAGLSLPLARSRSLYLPFSLRFLPLLLFLFFSFPPLRLAAACIHHSLSFVTALPEWIPITSNVHSEREWAVRGALFMMKRRLSADGRLPGLQSPHENSPSTLTSASHVSPPSQDRSGLPPSKLRRQGSRLMTALRALTNSNSRT